MVMSQQAKMTTQKAALFIVRSMCSFWLKDNSRDALYVCTPIAHEDLQVRLIVVQILNEVLQLCTVAQSEA